MKVPSDRISDPYRMRNALSVLPRIGEVQVRQPIRTGLRSDFIEALGRSRVQRKKVTSLLEQLEMLALPSLSDPALLSHMRSTEVLQHVINAILPRLEANSEVVKLAEQVLVEEIELRMEWSARQTAAEGEHDT